MKCKKCGSSMITYDYENLECPECGLKARLMGIDDEGFMVPLKDLLEKKKCKDL